MDVCRICDQPSTEGQNIFCKNADGKQILQLIRETLPVVIYRNDPLSKEICLSCLKNVEKIHAFRKSCLKVVNKHRDVLNGKQNKDALLYLQLLDNIDQKELWMYSSPVKKTFNKETPMCFNCKTEITSPKVEKPFKKYKELPRKSDTNSSLNGYLNSDEELNSSNNKKRKRLPILDFDSISAGSLPKRKKIIGPKCVSQPFVRTVHTRTTIFNPLSLLNLSLNIINKSIIPELITEHYEQNISITEKEEYTCEYCMETYPNQIQLAKHEVTHMKVNLTRVDSFEIWNSSFDDSLLRNKWLHDTFDDTRPVKEENEEEEDLLVPLVETGNEVNGEIELVNTKAMVNGVPLADMPKTERRLYYNKNYVVNGLKRKFCPLCRYTFKDNWAIELHYFSSACFYTCKYCGIRFNKQRTIFQEHINLHIQRGDPISEEVYASKKKNDPVPKVLCKRASKSLICTSPLHTEQPVQKVQKPQKQKHFETKTFEIKTPVIDNKQPSATGGQSQAYFCRKCYKVFFKLDEFNQHTEECEGAPADDPPIIEKKPQIKPVIKVEPKIKYSKTPPLPSTLHVVNEAGIKVSSTGRPVRNCVRDVKYKDHLDIDLEAEEETPKAKPKDFECVVCHAIFPTMLSRNSHMRVHKNGYQYGQKTNRHYNHQTYDAYDEVVSFKQEQLEPLVEIHESSSEQDIPSNIGAVSITPIPNKRHKTAINADIMRLVQSNPNITIRSMNHSPLEPQTVLTEGSMDDGSRTYKCSSCSRAFTSKSTLYFHKKNQCEGSRYPCPFCKKRFGTESAYSAHIFYSHPE